MALDERKIKTTTFLRLLFTHSWQMCTRVATPCHKYISLFLLINAQLLIAHSLLQFSFKQISLFLCASKYTHPVARNKTRRANSISCWRGFFFVWRFYVFSAVLRFFPFIVHPLLLVSLLLLLLSFRFVWL